MNDDVLAGLLIGLLIGGAIGALVMAVVAAGSGQRLSRASANGETAADAPSPSGATRAESSRHVDLLVNLGDAPRSAEPPES